MIGLSESNDAPAYRWPSMGGLEARNRAFLRVVGPWGPETTCFHVFAPGGPKPRLLRVFGLLDVEKHHSEWAKPGIEATCDRA